MATRLAIFLIVYLVALSNAKRDWDQPRGLETLQKGELAPLVKSETRGDADNLLVLFTRTFCAQSERAREELQQVAITWNSVNVRRPPVRFIEADLLLEESLAKTLGVISTPSILLFRPHSPRPVFVDTFMTYGALLTFLRRSTRTPPVELLLSTEDAERFIRSDELAVIAIDPPFQPALEQQKEEVPIAELSVHSSDPFSKFYRLAASHLLSSMSFGVIRNMSLAESLCSKGILPSNISASSSIPCYAKDKATVVAHRQGRTPLLQAFDKDNPTTLGDWLRDRKELNRVVERYSTERLLAKTLAKSTRASKKGSIFLCIRDTEAEYLQLTSTMQADIVENVAKELTEAVLKVESESVMAGIVEGPVTTALISTLGFGDAVGLWRRLGQQKHPQALLLYANTRTDSFFVADEAVTFEATSIAEFLRNCQSKTAPRLRRSSEVAVGLDNLPSFGRGVATVTFNNFEKIVLQDTRDTLLFVNAPYCGYCQRFLPYFLKLRDTIASERPDLQPRVKLGILDVTLNDVPDCLDDFVEEYPEILLVQGGISGKCSPLKYSGDGRVSDLLSFLDEHAHIQHGKEEL